MGVPVWLEGAADVGALAAGLALPLAFVQLAGLRRDRLRGQVDKVAAWPEVPAPLKSDGFAEVLWSVPLRVRNSSELPVFVGLVVAEVRPWDAAPVAPERESEESGLGAVYTERTRGPVFSDHREPGVVAPGATWARDLEYRQDLKAGISPQVAIMAPPRVVITVVVVTDAAGRRWKIRGGRAGPARRIHRWERLWLVPQ